MQRNSKGFGLLGLKPVNQIGLRRIETDSVIAMS
jgi:hypothetical protein